MLRPYQRALVGGLHRAVKEGADAVLMQSPTGSGKTSTCLLYTSTSTRYGKPDLVSRLLL